MYIYTYIGRARSPEDAQRICRMFGHLHALLVEPGYRRGECAVSTEDPSVVFIHEHWANLASWQAWEPSKANQDFVSQAETLLDNGKFEGHLYLVLAGGPS